MNELQIEWIPIDQINPSPYNPRKKLKPSDPEYRKLKKSIKQFGYVDPLIWNKRTGHLVGGYQRFQILKDEGVDQVQVSVVVLNLEQEKALNLALNRISGKWDESLLSSLLAELDDDLLSITGFEDDEIQKLLKAHEANMKTEFLTSFIESTDKTESNSTPKSETNPSTESSKQETVSQEDPPQAKAFPINFSVTPDERAIVLGAVQKAKIEFNLQNSNEAFVQVCRLYYGGHS